MEDWQKTCDELVGKSGNRWLRFLRTRVVVDMKAPFGAQVGFRNVSIGPETLGASEVEKRYLLSHELGHLAFGHPFISTGSALAFITAAFSVHPKFPVEIPPLVAITLLVVGFVGMAAYLRNLRFEHAADRWASRLVGKDTIIAGIRSVAKRRPPEHGHLYEKKISALEER